MLEWLVKKVLCSKVNGLLAKHKVDADNVKGIVKTWILRIQRVMSCLEALIAKLDDNEITADEVRQSTDEIAKLIKEW